MSTGKEIREKISSVKNTQKITKAMEMVSTSKMRKTQLNMLSARPYADNIMRVIAHISKATSEYRSPLLEKREVNIVGIIIITSDRGLCGGLNANLLRSTIKKISELQSAGKKVKIALIGSKSVSFFKSIGGDVISSATNLGDTPHLSQIIGCIHSMTEAFKSKEIDEVLLASNKYVNTVTQQPKITELLPVKPSENAQQGKWDYIYEPDSAELLDALITRYIENLIFKSLIENIACEQAARMLAMKNATDNAGNMIDELNLAYNKARQASITQELSEIIGGAAAV